jgi:PAS domain S-box-containing protein
MIPSVAPKRTAAGGGKEVAAGEIAELRARVASLEADLARERSAREWIEQSSEAAWRCELDVPLAPALAEDAQIDHIYRHARLADGNDAMARMYGFTKADEIRGVRLGSMLPPEDAANREFLRAFIRSGYRLEGAESHELDRDGRSRWFSNSLVGVVEDGLLVRALGTQRDVTDRKDLEEDLRQAMKMEALGRLAAGLAHDFNNLLTAIIGHAEMADERLPEGSEVRHDVDSISVAAERAASLTRQLLAIARRQVVQPVALDLNEVIRRLESVLTRLLPRDVTLVTQLAPGLWPVLADRGQMEQVLLNLAVNARDAMPGGGRLELETSNVELESGEHVAVLVSDSGTGMDDEVRRHLFEPYFTTKEVGRGSGLGLATCHGIVAQTGGRIEVTTEPERGSTFRVSLPRAPVAAPAAPAPRDETELDAPRGTENVLVVEDEPAVRLLACRVLRALGYEVVEARNGDEALEVLQRRSSTIDLMLTDMVMPRMSGRELAERARRVDPGLRILFMSGYPGSSVLDGDAAVRHFLPKPFTRAVLASAVRQALDLN